MTIRKWLSELGYRMDRKCLEDDMGALSESIADCSRRIVELAAAREQMQQQLRRLHCRRVHQQRMTSTA